jgi:predicted amidohydrolase YtcJ
VIYNGADPNATAMLIPTTACWLRRRGASADTTVELSGALVTPGFVDAHVHATDTGISLADSS